MSRRYPAIVLLLICLSLAACSGKAKRGTKFGSDVIRASDQAAQQLFDEGVAALDAQQWQHATERLRLVQSQYPNDPIAIVAELYAARAGLGELAVLRPPAAAVDVSDTALGALSQLADSRVDARVRWAAAAYYAAGLATLGSHAEAAAALASYPSSTLSPVVRAGDRAPLQALVSEGLLGAGRFAEAVAAYAELWRLGDDDLRQFARSRAFEAAQRLDEAALVDGAGEKDEFVRAVSGLVLLERRVARASDDETDALQTLMRRVAPDVVRIGEGHRLQNVSFALASRAPARRLALGLVLPLSGAAGQAGRAALDGALVVLDAYERKAATTTLLLVDSETASPREDVATLRVAGVAAIVGPLDHRRAEAWAEAANDAEVPLFSLTTEPLGSAAGDWAFRWFIDAESEARGVARVAVTEQGDKRIVVLRPNIGYGRRSAAWFREEAERLGASVVLDEEYDRSATDYSRLAARVAKLQPDAIFVPDTATKVGEVSAFLAQTNVWGIDGTRRPDPRAKRVQVHYLGTSLWNDAALLRQARSYVAGALIPAWSSAAFDDAQSRQFFADYSRLVGRSPNDLAAFAADGVRFVRQGFATGATDPLAIRDVALSPTLTHGITGSTRFAAGGEPVRVLRFVTVADGQFLASPRTVTVGLDDET